jgi:DNA repair exonuclease SbcCD ATPase subunit
MRQLKFKYASAKNFMCFGPEGIELRFQNYGNVVLVTGKNLDTGGSNGAGKSTIQDILSWGLFGKTVKRPKQLKGESLLNADNPKKLEVIVEFDDVRIQRNLEPSKLRLWQSDDGVWDKTTELTKTGPETQKLINRLVGLSHSAFCNVVVFDDRNFHSFLELEAAGKREIVENLLGLDKYREYNEVAKEMLKDIKKAVATLTADYARLQNEVDTVNNRTTQVVLQEKQYRETKYREYETLVARGREKQEQLAAWDVEKDAAKYTAAQERIPVLEEMIAKRQEDKIKLTTLLETARKKLDESRRAKEQLYAAQSERSMAKKEAEGQIVRSRTLIQSLERLEEGHQCPTCYGQVSKHNSANVVKKEKSILQHSEDAVSKEETALVDIRTKLQTVTSNVGKLEEGIGKAETQLRNVEESIRSHHVELNTQRKVEPPQLDAKAKVLESELIELKRQAIAKREEFEGISPYREILETARKDLETKTQERDIKTAALRQAEKEISYYEYWVEAFGDKGIRKIIIDGIIPGLNNRIAFWLRYLTGSYLELSFNNEFTPAITRKGRSVKYENLSNGETQKTNLAISQSFGYIMVLNAGTCPSIIFLDEVTGGGIDRESVGGVYSMIFELAKDRQVFVTSHNPVLLDLLDGCETITVVKKDDVSTIIS